MIHRSRRIAAGRWLPALLAVAAALAAACSGSEESVEPYVAAPIGEQVRQIASASVLIVDAPAELTPAIDTITIDPPNIVADRGESLQLSAQGLAIDGRTLADIEYAWSMVDPRAGTVTVQGAFVPGVTPGEFPDAVSVTAIQNTPEGIRFAAQFVSVTIVGELRVPTMASIAIIPPNPSLLPEQIFRLRAIAFDEGGAPIPDADFVWHLNESTIGRINDIGYLTIKKGVQGDYPAAVTVTGIWASQKLSLTTDVSIVNSPRRDDFLRVHALPQRFQLEPGDRLQLRAVALNGLGELVAGTELKWTMHDPDAGVIDGAGNFIAGSEPGIYTEAVRVDAVIPGEAGFVRAQDFASLVIQRPKIAGPLTRLSVLPHVLVVPLAGAATPRVRALDEQGEPAQHVSLSWNLRNREAGQVSEFGAFRAGAVPGTYIDALEVSATQDLGDEIVTKSTLVDVIVTGRLLQASITPSTAIIKTKRIVHFGASGTDEAGNVLDGMVVVWRVLDDDVGTVDSFGNFLAGTKPGLYENVLQAEVIQTLPIAR